MFLKPFLKLKDVIVVFFAEPGSALISGPDVTPGNGSAQPLFKDQCSANEFVLNGLKGWKDAGNSLSC